MNNKQPLRRQLEMINIKQNSSNKFDLQMQNDTALSFVCCWRKTNTFICVTSVVFLKTNNHIIIMLEEYDSSNTRAFTKAPQTVTLTYKSLILELKRGLVSPEGFVPSSSQMWIICGVLLVCCARDGSALVIQTDEREAWQARTGRITLDPGARQYNIQVCRLNINFEGWRHGVAG